MYRIIGNIEELKEVENYVLYHHEKYDGTEYPFRLKGEEIFIEELISCQAKHFDPNLAKIFIRLYEHHHLDDIFQSIN